MSPSKKDSKPQRYEQADVSPTSAAPSGADVIRPLDAEAPAPAPASTASAPTSPAPSVSSAEEPVSIERPEGTVAPAVLDSTRMSNPVGLKAQRAAARASE